METEIERERKGKEGRKGKQRKGMGTKSKERKTEEMKGR